MNAPLDLDRDAKSRVILEHELAFVHCAASRFVEKPTLSVWMVLIPIVFLYWMQRHQRYKQGVAAVTEELMRSRRRALDAALGRAGETSNEASNESAGDPLLTALRAAEARETAVRAQHYRRLLDAEGLDYGALLRGAYTSPAAYQDYLAQLAAAEAAVFDAVRDAAQGQREVLETSTQLEKVITTLRAETAPRDYGAS